MLQCCHVVWLYQAGLDTAPPISHVSSCTYKCNLIRPPLVLHIHLHMYYVVIYALLYEYILTTLHLSVSVYKKQIRVVCGVWWKWEDRTPGLAVPRGRYTLCAAGCWSCGMKTLCLVISSYLSHHYTRDKLCPSFLSCTLLPLIMFLAARQWPDPSIGVFYSALFWKERNL